MLLFLKQFLREYHYFDSAQRWARKSGFCFGTWPKKENTCGYARI